MNKMPDRIWATPFDSDMDGGTYCDATERPTSPNHDAWCYVRADLARALTEERDRLREAIEYVLDGYGLNGPDYRFKDSEDGDWISDRLISALKGETP